MEQIFFKIPARNGSPGGGSTTMAPLPPRWAVSPSRILRAPPVVIASSPPTDLLQIMTNDSLPWARETATQAARDQAAAARTIQRSVNNALRFIAILLSEGISQLSAQRIQRFVQHGE